MLLAALAAAAFAAVRLRTSSSYQTSIYTSEDIVALYQKFLLAPTENYDNIVATSPVPWKGFEGYPRKMLVKKYFSRFDRLDFDAIVESYKTCKEAGELEAWLEGMKKFCKVNIAKQLEYIVIVSGLNYNNIDIGGLTGEASRSILKCTSPYNNKTNLSNLIDGFERDDENTTYCFNSTALTHVLKCKKYLMGMLIRALIPGPKMSSKVSFVRKILPMLDAETRKQFLDFLENVGTEHGGPFDLGQWGRENKVRATNEALLRVHFDDAKEKHNGSDSMNSSVCDYKCDVEIRAVKSIANSDAEMAVIALSFSIDEVVENILTFVEWRTLLQSVPFVSKRYNLTVTKIFVIQRSHDLERYTREKSLISNPYRMFLSYPWNRFFSSPHQLIKYDVLKCQQKGLKVENQWLKFIHHGLADKEVNNILLDIPEETNYPDNDLLKCSVLAGSSLSFDKSIPSDQILRIVDIFSEETDVQDMLLKEVYSSVCDYSHDGLVYWFKHAEYGAKMFRLSQKKSENGGYDCEIFNLAIAAIFVLDNLGISAGVTDAVKQYVAEKCGMTVNVPMTADQMQMANYDFFERLFRPIIFEHSVFACKVLVKLLSVYAENNLIELCASKMDESLVHHLLNYILFIEPKAMTVKQFESFISIVPPRYYDQIMEVLKSSFSFEQQNSGDQVLVDFEN